MRIPDFNMSDVFYDFRPYALNIRANDGIKTFSYGLHDWNSFFKAIEMEHVRLAKKLQQAWDGEYFSIGLKSAFSSLIQVDGKLQLLSGHFLADSRSSLNFLNDLLGSSPLDMVEAERIKRNEEAFWTTCYRQCKQHYFPVDRQYEMQVLHMHANQSIILHEVGEKLWALPSTRLR